MERLFTLVLGPLALCSLIYIFLSFLPYSHTTQSISSAELIGATLATLLRILIAYALASFVAVPLALLVELNPTIESLLLPIFDVFESVPNLAILPVLVVFFLQFHFLEGAAITILFLNMLWNIVFALVGGLKVIPKDVKDAAHIFGLRGLSYVTRLIVPSVVPQFITGSILAVASAWNIIIVAEALHAYAPASAGANDLYGIGSILVAASGGGRAGDYLIAFIIMIATIALFNFFVWQKLLNYSQRFRFD